MRVVRWLLARSEDVDDAYDLIHGPATLFPIGTAEYELHQLLRALLDEDDREQLDTPQAGTQTVPSASSDGSAELAHLRALLANSDGTDSETAEAVVMAARTWADAVAEWEAGEMAQIAVIREPVLKALHHLDSGVSSHEVMAFEDRVHELGLASLKELGPLAESVLERSAHHRSCAETFEATKAYKAELDRLEDYEALSEVVGKLAWLKTQQVAAHAALENAVNAFRAALVAEGGAPAEVEQETAHDDDGDSPDDVSEPGTPTEEIGRADIVGLGSSKAEPGPRSQQLEGLAADIIAPLYPTDDKEADRGTCDVEGDEAAEVPEGAGAEPFASMPEEEDVAIGEVTAAEPAKSVDEKPLTWGDHADFPNLLTHYLDKGEPILAFHLADLAIERGMEPGLPKSVLRSLALSGYLSGPDDPLLLQIDAALAEAVPKAENASQAVNGLVFAALLRPALLSPESSARKHLANLSMDGWLGAYGPLQHALSDLGYDFRLSVGELAELVGAVRERQVPVMVEALREWSDGAKASQGLHAPTAFIVHDIVGPAGEFGSVIEKVLSGDAKAEKAVHGLLEMFLDNRSALADLIDRRERAMGRPRRDKIRGIALDWACRKLIEGCAALDDWRHAKAADHGRLEGRRKAALERQINSLRKELTRLCRLDAPAVTLNEGLQDAAYRMVVRGVEELAMLLDGRAPVTAPRRAGDILRTPLLRLPGACMDDLPESSPDFATDRKVQRDRLFEALQEPDRTIAPDERSALSARIAESAILPARQLLEIVKRSKQIAARESESLAQEIAEREASTRAHVTNRVNSLRQSLVTLSNLYLGTGDELRKAREQLEEIASALTGVNELTLPATNDLREPGVPSDFPALAVLLDALECIRDEARTRIGEEQRVRLEKIASERSDLAPAVETILNALHSLDPITVEDTIATLPSLGSGQILTAHQQEEDPFETFFPSFVELVETASPNQGAVLTAARVGDVLGPLDFSKLEESGRTQAKLVP